MRRPRNLPDALLLRPYLEHKRFTIRMDHDSLKWILNLTNGTGRLARWSLQLSEFDFKVVLRAGVKREASEVLSRLQTASEDDTQLEDNLPILSNDAKSDDTSKLVIYTNSDDIIWLNTQEEKSIDTPQTLGQLIIKQALD